MMGNFFKLISKLVLPKIITIGIDIQDRHLIAVATSQLGNKNGVIASGVYELSDDAIENGELKNSATIRKAVRDFVVKIPGGRFKSSSEHIFILSIPPHHLYTETAFFPLMSEAELNEAIHLKIETSLPWPVDQAYVDWLAMPASGQKQIGVFIAAVSRQVLNEYLKIFLEEKWMVGACEFHMLSLSKFINPSYFKSFLFALIDEDGIEFSVFSNGKILTHYLQGVSSNEEVKKILEDKINHLINYIKGSFGIAVERVFIFDRINSEYVLTNIQEKTGIPAQALTPSPHLDPRLFIAQGASLRSYGPIESSLNLLPPEFGGRYRENLFLKTLSLWFKIFSVFGFTLIFAFTGALVFLLSQQSFFAKENAGLDSLFEQQLAKAEPLIKKAEHFNKLSAAVKAVSSRSMSGFRLAIAKKEAEKNGLIFIDARLVGPRQIAISLVAPTRESALEFEKALKSNGAFLDVNFPIAELSPEQNLNIHITLGI
ncbi:MAG: hypothetical protein AAB772_00485 [Patescibacteria group bacterium]